MQKSYNLKPLVFILSCLFSIGIFAQDTKEVAEEFIPIDIEGKDAFISTKTGEYTYREHAKTDPTQLKTTANGVIYTDVSNHTVKKGETLSAIAKKNDVTIGEIKKYNKITSSNLKIGSKVKIVKKILIKSSSPVIGTSGEERIIARLRPGESPGALAPPPPMEEIQKKLVKNTEKTSEKSLKPKYKAKNDIKNPMLGLDDKTEEVVEETKESKQERLKRLQAEMKALEAELKESEEEAEVTTEKVEAKADDAHDGHDHSKHAKELVKEEEKKEVGEINVTEVKEIVEEEAKEETIKAVEETIAKAEEESIIEEKKEEVVEEAEEESLAKKASRVVSQVKKTNKKVEETKEISKEKVDDSENKPAYFYTVKKGNSLWSIAKMHGMTVAELKKLNKLKNNYLDVGQKLRVNSKLKK